MKSQRCPTTVFWWDVQMTATCVRPAYHQGWHRDGVYWFDDEGNRRPSLEEVERQDLRRKEADPTKHPWQRDKTCTDCGKDKIANLGTHRWWNHREKYYPESA